MRTSPAIFLTIALTLLGSLVRFKVGDTQIDLVWIVILLTAPWAAIDSSKIQLRRYKSGIAYGPIALFVLCLLLWIVAFPWYLSMRYKIRTRTAVLKEVTATVAA
ncbi:MAG: hypothetical protein JWM68_4397 [Verrucomicrobiales bacterium]|nr:hypothetical protein [Verrucomicrobiales bacterium]